MKSPLICLISLTTFLHINANWQKNLQNAGTPAQEFIQIGEKGDKGYNDGKKDATTDRNYNKVVKTVQKSDHESSLMYLILMGTFTAIIAVLLLWIVFKCWRTRSRNQRRMQAVTYIGDEDVRMF